MFNKKKKTVNHTEVKNIKNTIKLLDEKQFRLLENESKIAVGTKCVLLLKKQFRK